MSSEGGAVYGGRRVRDAFANPPMLVKLGFGRKKREKVYRRLIYGLEGDRAVRDILVTVLDNETDDGKTSGGAIGKALRNWLARLGEGAPLSVAMRGWVPASHGLIVAAGEESSDLEGALKSAIELDSAASRMNKAMVGAVLYPFVLTGMVVGLVVMLSEVLLPQFVKMSDPLLWRGAAGLLYDMSLLVTPENGVRLAVGVVCVVGAVVFALPRWTGRFRDALAGIWPFSMYQLNWGTSFLLSVAALVQAGRPVGDALTLMEQQAKPWYREKLRKVQARIGVGLAFGEACWQADRNFPGKEVLRELRGATKLEEEVGRLARNFLEEAVGRMETMAKLGRSVGIMAVAGVVVTIILGVQEIMQDMNQTFQGR